MLEAIRALVSEVNAPSSLRLWARWVTLSPRNAALTGIQIETQRTLGIGTLDGPWDSSEVSIIHRLLFVSLSACSVYWTGQPLKILGGRTTASQTAGIIFMVESSSIDALKRAVTKIITDSKGPIVIRPD